VDIDPRYVDVAVQRWQRTTGMAAILAGEERTFNDIAAARGVQVAA
jgi:DNA modification methylase